MIALIATIAIIALLIAAIEALPIDSRAATILKVIVIVVGIIILLPLARAGLR